MNDALYIGAKIRDARKAAGLTQAELATLIGAATITIRQYETGKRTPRPPQIRRIANALNSAISELVPPDYWSLLAGPESHQESAEMWDDQWSAKTHGALLRAFAELNAEGQRVAVERIKELAEISRYRRPLPNPDEREAADNAAQE